MAAEDGQFLPPDGLDRDALLDRFHREWNLGKRPSVRAFLDLHAGAAVASDFVYAVLSIDLEHRLAAGNNAPLIEDYIDLARSYDLSQGQWIDLGRQDYQGRWARGDTTARREEYRRIFPRHHLEVDGWRPVWICPSCHREDIPLGDETDREAKCPRCQAIFMTEHLFRPSPVLDMRDYARVRDLGSGGMGEVFESRDPTLNRSRGQGHPRRLPRKS